MKVWWCEEHEAAGSSVGCDVRGSGFNPCRMVEMQLVPVDARMVGGDALVIEKVNGEWPEWLTDVDSPIWHQCGQTYGLLDDIFDALAEAQK